MEASDRNIALDLYGPYVELGTMEDVLFTHDDSLRLSFELGLKLPEAIEIVDASASRSNYGELPGVRARLRCRRGLL